MVIQWLDVNFWRSVVFIWVGPDDWLQLIGVDSSHLPYYSHLHLLLLVLRLRELLASKTYDGHVRWRMVLLITHQNVGNQRAFTWKKGDSNLNCFAVPVLTTKLVKIV